jgi:hypothetical protein
MAPADAASSKSKSLSARNEALRTFVYEYGILFPCFLYIQYKEGKSLA